MAYRYNTLSRLGVEQLPNFCTEHGLNDMGNPSGTKHEYAEHINPFSGNPPIRSVPVPGRRCPCCMARGQTIWVIPGKRCPQCGTEVN